MKRFVAFIIFPIAILAMLLFGLARYGNSETLSRLYNTADSRSEVFIEKFIAEVQASELPQGFALTTTSFQSLGVEGLWMSAVSSTAQCEKAVYYLHGNAGPTGGVVREIVESIVQSGCSAHVLMIWYPGYGRSEGEPSTAAIEQAVLTGYDELKTRFPLVDKYVLGHSMGTYPALWLATQPGVADEAYFLLVGAPVSARGLCHDRTKGVVGESWDFLKYLACSQVTELDTLSLVPLVGEDVRLCIFHSAADERIPLAHPDALGSALGTSFIYLEPNTGWIGDPMHSARDGLSTFDLSKPFEIVHSGMCRQ